VSAPSFAWTDVTVREALGLAPAPSARAAPLATTSAATTSAVEAPPAFDGVTTDSRTARAGELYVALVGERFDGHEFVGQALAAGARAAVVSRPVDGVDAGALYLVDDTLEALGLLAAYRRAALPARVVGITGSAGKTTTKELVTSAVSRGLRVHATRANLNNRVGVPLTLLGAPLDAEVVVVEMGTNEPGEIRALARIVRPDVAVITTVGESHLAGLGNLQGVLREKLDLLRELPANARAVVGDEGPELPAGAREIIPGVLVAGWTFAADPSLRPRAVEVDPAGCHRFRWQDVDVTLRIPGRHVVLDALLALAVARMLGVDPAKAAAGVGAVEASALRGEVRRVGGLTLVLDCYNANPQSVRASLDALDSMGGTDRKVVVLGTMLELGAVGPDLHRDVLAEAQRRGVDLLVATGEFARAADPRAEAGGGLIVEEDIHEAYRRLRERLTGAETVLLKASRGVALESLVPRFEEDFGGPSTPAGAEGLLEPWRRWA
jgi:UDP-N-acetylmuramoyl-tripeptide--D-alanyl-D-alanine ligase